MTLTVTFWVEGCGERSCDLEADATPTTPQELREIVRRCMKHFDVPEDAFGLITDIQIKKDSMKVFYDSRQAVAHNPSLSPSAGKPTKVLAAWEEKFPGRIEIMPVTPCTKEDLYLAHEPEFVDAILECRLENGFNNKLKTIADSLLWTNGSFKSAAEYAVRHKTQCVSPTSGFHHAEYNTAMGFCTFNGLMVTAIDLKNKKLVDKIAIADIDMHYGNGADQIMDLLKIDYVSHYTFGADHNPPDRAEPDFLQKLPGYIEKVIDGADVLFYQAGADPHVNDPYGGALTTEELKERDRIVFSIAKSRNVPVVWNLAGGYQSDLSKVLEIHNNTAAMHLEIFEGGV